MIMQVYAFKNKKSDNFNAPIFQYVPKEAAVEFFSVSVREMPADKKEYVKELDLYYVGTFDTKSGVLEAGSPEYLMSNESVLNGKDSEENK